MDICTNACERNVANNEKVNYSSSRIHIYLFSLSVHRQSKSCWTSATDQAGMSSLARVLASTSAMRWVEIVDDDNEEVVELRNENQCIIHIDDIEEISIAGLKTPLHVLCWQPRRVCVEMFVVIFCF